MSPEVALLVRAALLGLLVFALERFSRRRYERRAELRRTLVRLPATHPPATSSLVGRPLQVSVKQKHIKPAVTASAKPSQTDILRLEPHTAPVYITEQHPFDGHVTEKRAA